MNSREISIPVSGSQMNGYLSGPDERSGAHPAVIVLPEIFGLTPEARRVTDLLASIGYNGLAIDHYHRSGGAASFSYTEDGNRRAFEAAARVGARQIIEDVAAAVEWLSAQSFVKPAKIATWGFGFGGTAAFVSSSVRQLSGAICFYPTFLATPMPSGGEPPLDHAGEVEIPLLLIFGELDYYVSRHDMDRIAQKLEAERRDFQMQIYPAVGHSFFRHGRPEAIPEKGRYSDEAIAQAVADSWNLVQKFLRDRFSRSSATEVGSGGSRISNMSPAR